MKIKKNPELILRNVEGEAVLIPTGSFASKFNGMISLNGPAAFIWEQMENVSSREELVQKMLERYDVDEETARRDVNGFLDTAIYVGYAMDEDAQAGA